MEYRIDSLTVLCVDRDHIHPGDIYRVVLISRDPRLTPGKVRQIQRLYPFVGVAHRSYSDKAGTQLRDDTLYLAAGSTGQNMRLASLMLRKVLAGGCLTDFR